MTTFTRSHNDGTGNPEEGVLKKVSHARVEPGVNMPKI